MKIRSFQPFTQNALLASLPRQRKDKVLIMAYKVADLGMPLPLGSPLEEGLTALWQGVWSAASLQTPSESPWTSSDGHALRGVAPNQLTEQGGGAKVRPFLPQAGLR